MSGLDEKDGYYIRGGQGSHWANCEETHWDCKIIKLEADNARLQKAVDEAIETVKLFPNPTEFGLIWDECILAFIQAQKFLKEYGKKDA